MDFSQFGSMDDFMRLDTQKLIDHSVTDFDVFVKVEQDIVLYGCSGYEWRKDEIDQLLDFGINELWIKNSDSHSLELYQRLNSFGASDTRDSTSQRVMHIEDVGKEFTKCLFEAGATPATVHKGLQIAADIGEVALGDPKAARELSLLLDHDAYTYTHSVRVGVYAACIASELDYPSRLVTQIATGALFHDVGKRSIDLKVLHKNGALLEHEWDLMRSHPILGFDELKHSNLSLAAKEIVIHHHESLDGSGYPHGLRSNEILDEVKIVTLADIFDALTSCRSYQKERSKYEALKLIRDRMLHKKVEASYFEALIRCLS